jgi:hypothetical protein
MDTLLAAGHWQYIGDQSRLAQEAHNTGDFMSEKGLLRETLRYLAMLFGVLKAGGKNEPIPPHSGLLRMLSMLRDDDVSTAEIEAAVSCTAAGLAERTILVEFSAR